MRSIFVDIFPSSVFVFCQLPPQTCVQRVKIKYGRSLSHDSKLILAGNQVPPVKPSQKAEEAQLASHGPPT